MFDFLQERKPIIILIALLVVVILGFSLLSKRKEAEEPAIEIKKSLKNVVGEIDIRNAFIEVADKVGPAVVSISTERVHKFKTAPFQFRRPPFQDEFFDYNYAVFWRGANSLSDSYRVGHRIYIFDVSDT